MFHTVLRRRANGESIEDIRPDLYIPTGKRKGKNPSLASIYRALAEHEKRQATRGRRAGPRRLRRFANRCLISRTPPGGYLLFT